MLGDFNNVLDNKLDICAGLPHTEENVLNFNNFIDDMDLTDGWRLSHPDEKQYSWSRKTPFTARRLDYIFFGRSVIPFVEVTEIQSLGFSDHRAVRSTMKFSPFQRGPSYYKLNISLFRDTIYVKKIKDTIKATREAYSDLDAHIIWDMINKKCSRSINAL